MQGVGTGGIVTDIAETQQTTLGRASDGKAVCDGTVGETLTELEGK